MTKDQREHPRVRIPLAVEYQLKDRRLSQQATLVDLSLGGVAILTEDPLPAGGLLAFLHFKLGAPDDSEAAEIRAATEIVRCVEQRGVGRAREFLVGAQFLNLDEHSYETLREFVGKRLSESDDSEVLEPRLACEQPIAIQYQRFDDFVNEVAINLSSSGMFIRAKKPPPPGTVLEFSFQLGDDFNLIAGKAEVVWNRSLAGGPERPAGMGVKFLELDPVSKRVLEQILEKGLGKDKAGDESATDPGAAARIAELEQERAALQEILDRLREQLQGSLGHHTEVRRELEERLADVEHERDRRRHEQRSLEQRLEALQTEHEAALTARATDQVESETIRSRIDTVQTAARNELEAAATTLRAERETAEAKAETLRAEREAAEANTEQAGRELNAMRAELEAVQTESERRASENASQAERIAALEAELVDARGAIDAGRGDAEAARAETEEAIRAAQSERQQLSELRTATIELERQIQEATDRNQALTGELAEEQQARTESSRRIDDLRASMIELQHCAELPRSASAAKPSALRAATFVGFGLILGFMASYPFETLLVAADPITIRPARSVTRSGRAPEAVPTADSFAASALDLRSEIVTTAPDAIADPPVAELDRPAPKDAVERWAAAWSEQRVADYLGSYAGSFAVPEGLERSAWELQRTRRIQGPESIRLKLGQIEISTRGPDAVTATFNQSYVAGAYSDRVRKTLELVWEEGSWRIARETSAPLAEPAAS